LHLKILCDALQKTPQCWMMALKRLHTIMFLQCTLPPLQSDSSLYFIFNGKDGWLVIFTTSVVVVCLWYRYAMFEPVTGRWLFVAWWNVQWLTVQVIMCRWWSVAWLTVGWLSVTKPYISALRGYCRLKFSHALEIDQVLLAYTPTRTGSTSPPQKKINCKSLNFGLKSACEPL